MTINSRVKCLPILNEGQSVQVIRPTKTMWSPVIVSEKHISQESLSLQHRMVPTTGEIRNILLQTPIMTSSL